MNMRSMAAAVLLLAAIFGARADDHKGSVKPNWELADFTKHDEAYYLTLDQIRIGWSQEQVVAQYGNKYKVVDSKTVDGKLHESWKFTSYRARMLSDPVDSLVTVDFVDGVVVHAKQVPAPGSDVAPAELVQEAPAAPQESTADRLKQLQQLLDEKLITPEEYEAKRKAIVDGL